MTKELLSTKNAKVGRFRPQDRISYLDKAIRSIIRNKRRSMSMISGLILGISILAGILLYTTVLMNNVYNSIIEGSPYEIRMDFDRPLTDQEIESYRQQFDDNIKIYDAQTLYGNGRTIVETSGMSTNIYTSAYLRAEIRAEYNNETYSGSEGKIFSFPFYEGAIGENIRNKILTGKNPGVYTKDSTNYHGILISESLAETAKLQQGNKLISLTLSITTIDPDDPAYPFGGEEIQAEVSLENITIAGIMASTGEASAGLFSEALEGVAGGEIYIPEELFADQNKTSFLETLKENEMRYCVLKINEGHFDLSSPTGVNSQINQLINEFEVNTALIGTNLVESKLMPFQILSIFIFFFDGILTIPVAILAIFLLSFGVDLSLHERRYQVGILKTQGASPKQIKRKILMETLLLAAVGLVLGYIVSIFGAWGIGTATGFMKWDWAYAFSELPSFIIFDQTAFFVVGGLIVIILIVMVNGKAQEFIQMEITETVRRTDKEKQGFLRRNNLDIIFFIVGFGTLVLVILTELGVSINLGPAIILLALLGPFLFWIGGAAVVARLAIWIPSKTDPLVRRIGFLKDISILIKGNIFRKSGDIPRLALIIALTVSFSILAAVQGTTGQVHKERMIEFDIGADIVVNTGFNISTLTISEINKSENIENVMAMTNTAGELRNDPVSIYSIDAEVYGEVGKWQGDSIPAGGGTIDELMEALDSNSADGCLIGKNIKSQYKVDIGGNITIKILAYYWNGSMINYGYLSRNLTIHGIFDHTPSGIGGGSIIVDHELVNSLSNMNFIAALLGYPEITDPKAVSASKYLVQVKKDVNVEDIKENLDKSKWVISSKTLEGEIREANEIQQMDFGIPGLLTADFVISLLAATLATFIFMSILMEKRKKEFAILRSYGASQRQVYKIVFSEAIVLLLTAVVWGLLIGLGLSILFNPFFEFMDVFITPLSALAGGGSINRVLVFDAVGLIFTVVITFLAMISATFLSVRGASKAKISTVVREL
ncbi:MAG: FtsX-like permease family protein [Candidatus Hodarchaeales archaeon]|jgi:ABC-type lipoprotein release transport system permease subunit